MAKTRKLKKVKKEPVDIPRCIVCGKALRSPRSIAMQMGPTCARRVIGLALKEDDVISIRRSHLRIYSDRQRRLFTRKEAVKHEDGEESSQVSNG